jgi:hypothetical protein
MNDRIGPRDRVEGEGTVVDGVLPGGSRRIDRVLAENFLSDLSTIPLAEVRALRDEADQEETDLSYLRRLLQGRLDLVRAEMDRRRRGDAESADLVAQLSTVLADGDRPEAHGLGRYRSAEPSRVGDTRRYLETLLSDVDLSNPHDRSDAELALAQDILTGEESKVSVRRRAVQVVFDAASAEITRRYRDGEADIGALLGPEGGLRGD